MLIFKELIMSSAYKIWIRKTTFIWICFIGFAICYVNLKFFYPIRFHGDSASMQVLAEAIKSEKSLLPRDFYYGNQLIIFRASLFIAIANSMGFSGYDAFIIGSSLCFSLWFLITFLIIRNIIGTNIDALTISVAVFIPLGLCDFDFIIGQQSHLSNVVFTTLTCFATFRFIQTLKYPWLLLSLSPILLMTIEAPIRAVLLILPLAITIFIYTNINKTILITLTLFFVIILGYCLNYLLLATVFPLGVDYMSTLTMRGVNEIARNISFIFIDILTNTTSSPYFSGHLIKGVGFPFYVASFLPLLYFFILFFYGIVITSKNIIYKINGSHIILKNNALAFALTLSTIGLIIGLVTISSLNPDSGRHILWALTLLKLIAVIQIYLWLKARFCRRIFSVIIFLSSMLLVSCWVPIFLYAPPLIDRDINLNKNLPINNEITSIMNATNIRNIYGINFWRMMPLNSLAKEVYSGEIIYNGGNIIPVKWLSRPSWFCIKGNVLYYTKDSDADKIIEQKLQEMGGVKIYTDKSGTIWRGPVLWATPSYCTN